MYNGKRVVYNETDETGHESNGAPSRNGRERGVEERNGVETDNGYLAACLVSKCKAGKEWNGVEKEKEVQPVHLLVR